MWCPKVAELILEQRVADTEGEIVLCVCVCVCVCMYVCVCVCVCVCNIQLV